MSALFNPLTAIPEYTRPEGKMDAIIGRYRVLTEETSLTLTHPTGLSFALTLTEAIELMEFIKVHQTTIAAALDAAAADDDLYTADVESIYDQNQQ